MPCLGPTGMKTTKGQNLRTVARLQPSAEPRKLVSGFELDFDMRNLDGRIKRE